MNIQRDTYTSYTGDYRMLAYFAIPENDQLDGSVMDLCSCVSLIHLYSSSEI
jgi:hypothetical protein